MKRFSLFGALLLVLLLVPGRGAWAFGVKDVVAMHKEGVADSLIIVKIRHSDAVFHLNAKDLAMLQSEGVSDQVVGAMLRTEDRRDYGYGDYPYYGYYDGWPGWGPRFSLGFDYYYYPRYGYRPYYGPRYYGYGGFRHPGGWRYGGGYRR